MIVFRHIAEALLNPFCLVMIGFTLLLFCLYQHQGAIKLFTGFSFLYLILLLSSLGWLPQALTRHLENQYPEISEANPEIHWVVVLSGGQAETAGKPANSLLYNASIKRLLEGIRLFRQLPSAQLLLSGGGYGREIPESQRMAQLAGWFAIPRDRLVLETQSLNTAGQAKAIKAWVGNEPFYLVTSAIHMPRAMALCQAQGLHPVAAPTDFTLYWQDERWMKFYLPNPHNMVYLSIALHELMGMGWGKLKKNDVCTTS